MATVEEVQAKLTALIANLSPQARRQLGRKSGKPYEKANRTELHANKIPMVQPLNRENHVKNLAKRKGESNAKPCSPNSAPPVI